MTESRRPISDRWIPKDTLTFSEVMDPRTSAFLIVDPQQGIMSPKGTQGKELPPDSFVRFEETIATIVGMVHTCRAIGVPIIWTKRENNRELMSGPQSDAWSKRILRGKVEDVSFQPGTDDCKLMPALGKTVRTRGDERDIIITKVNNEDPFNGSTSVGDSLRSILKDKGITTLVVAGITTERCVRSSVVGAADRGIYSVVVRDAVQSTYQEDHECGLRALSTDTGYIMTAAEIRAYWSKRVYVPLLPPDMFFEGC